MNHLDYAVSFLAARVAYARGEFMRAVGRNPGLPPMLSGDAPLDVFAGLDDDQKQRLALTTSWVYAAVRLLAQEVSGAELNILQRVGETTDDVPNHPFEIMMQSPNPQMSGVLLWQYTMYWLSLRGKAFWYLAPQKGSASSIAEIWPLQADRVGIKPGQKQFVEKYLYRLHRGTTVEIDPRNVVFFRYPHPFNLWDGLAPLGAASLAMQTDLGESRWQRDTYVSGRGIPHSVILLDKNMGDRDFEVTSARIREDFEQERKVAIARGGDMKVETVGISPRDLQLIDSREFSRDEIDTVFLGVPLHRVISETGLAAADKMFKEKMVYPIHRLLAGQLTSQLVVPYFGDEFLAEFEDVRPQDRSLTIQEFQTFNKAMTFDEAREFVDLERFSHPVFGWLGALPISLVTDANFVLQVMGMAVPGASQIEPPSEGGLPALPEANAPQSQTAIEAGRGTVENVEASPAGESAETLKAKFEAALDEFQEALKHYGPEPHRSGSPQSAHGGEPSIGVGITSHRPGKAPREVFEQMDLFHDAMLKAGIKDVKIQPGYGAWEGGGEPTWVLSYRGDGDARLFVIRTAKQYDQDSVLFMSPCTGGGCAPVSEFSFGGKVYPPQRAVIHKYLVEGGYTGWTWHKKGGSTYLRAVYVEKWMSITPDQFIVNSRSLRRRFAQEFHMPVRWREKAALVEAIEKHEYDSHLADNG